MQSGVGRYYTLAVATLGFVVLGVSLFNYPAISTLVSREFELSNTESGILTSIFALTYAIIQIPSGLVADRIGGTRSLLISLSIMAIAPLIFIVGDNFDTALVSRAIAGVGAGMVLPSDVRILSSSFSETELHRASGILGTGWGGSQTLAYALLPVLVVGQDWHPPLLFTVVFSLAVAIMCTFSVKLEGPPAPPVKIKTNVRGILTRRLLVLVLGNFTALVVVVGILAWTPHLLSSHLGLSNVVSGQLIAIVGITGVASSFAGGFLGQRIGARPVILASMTLLVAVPYLLAVSDSWVTAVIWIALLGVGANLYFGPLIALVPYSSKQGVVAAGITFGVFNTLSNIGSILSPAIIGLALDITGSYVIGFTTLGLLGLSGVVGALLIRK